MDKNEILKVQGLKLTLDHRSKPVSVWTANTQWDKPDGLVFFHLNKIPHYVIFCKKMLTVNVTIIFHGYQTHKV